MNVNGDDVSQEALMTEEINEFLEDLLCVEQRRSMEARKRPEDGRYENSARALGGLYKYVLEARDPLVQELADALESIRDRPDAVLSYMEELPYALGQFGFETSINLETNSLVRECHEFVDQAITMIDKLLCRSISDEFTEGAYQQ